MLFIFSICKMRIQPVVAQLQFFRETCLIQKRNEKKVVLIEWVESRDCLCGFMAISRDLHMPCTVSAVPASHSVHSTCNFSLNYCDFLFAVYLLPLVFDFWEMVFGFWELTKICLSSWLLYIEHTLSGPPLPCIFTLEIPVHLSGLNLKCFLQKLLFIKSPPRPDSSFYYIFL